eukprot:366551-Chlamydomonas_euryale.AAC.34
MPQHLVVTRRAAGLASDGTDAVAGGGACLACGACEHFPCLHEPRPDRWLGRRCLGLREMPRCLPCWLRWQTCVK